MSKFVYLSIAVPSSHTRAMEQLNAWGKQGWELCCHEFGEFILKREELQEQKEPPATPEDLSKVIASLVDGLCYDGAHHKQEALASTLKALVGEEIYKIIKERNGWE